MVGFEDMAYSVLESQPSSVNVCVVLTGATERAIEINMTSVEGSAAGEFDASFLMIILWKQVTYISKTSITPVNSSDYTTITAIVSNRFRAFIRALFMAVLNQFRCTLLYNSY